MKISVTKALRNGIHSHRLSHRRCSSRSTINLIKSNLIKDENVLQKHSKKEFKILQQLGLKFKESTADNSKQNNDNGNEFELDTSQSYPVGHFPNQYPSIAHSNISQFSKLFTSTNTSLEHWIIDHATKKTLNLPITSTLEYHPFSLTYPSQSSNKTKTSSKTWKLSSKSPHHFIDAIDDEKVPILTRKLDKKTTQALVLFRDLHQNMSNLKKMEAIINAYEPNKIILELPPDGGSVALKSFKKLRFKYCVFPFIKHRQSMVLRKSNEAKVGGRWMKLIRKFLCLLPPSYAQIMAVNMAISQNIPIVCADYSEKSMVGTLALAECLDLYQAALLKKMKFPVEKLKQLMLQSDHLLSTNFLRVCSVRLQPHLYVLSSYRNDLMSLAINECMEERLLFVGGEAHCYDIVDRLCGKVRIANPFKEVREQRVLLRDMTSGYNGHSTVGVVDLVEEDIEIAKKVLGDDALLMMLPNDKYDSVEEMKSKMTLERHPK